MINIVLYKSLKEPKVNLKIMQAMVKISRNSLVCWRKNDLMTTLKYLLCFSYLNQFNSWKAFSVVSKLHLIRYAPYDHSLFCKIIWIKADFLINFVFLLLPKFLFIIPLLFIFISSSSNPFNLFHFPQLL